MLNKLAISVAVNRKGDSRMSLSDWGEKDQIRSTLVCRRQRISAGGKASVPHLLKLYLVLIASNGSVSAIHSKLLSLIKLPPTACWNKILNGPPSFLFTFSIGWLSFSISCYLVSFIDWSKKCTSTTSSSTIGLQVYRVAATLFEWHWLIWLAVIRSLGKRCIGNFFVDAGVYLSYSERQRMIWGTALLQGLRRSLEGERF